MNRRLISSIVALAASAAACLGQDDIISVQLDDVPLTEVIRMMEKIREVEIEVDKGIDLGGKGVSIDVEDKQWHVVLKDMLRPHGLTVEEVRKEKQVYKIVKIKPDANLTDADRKAIAQAISDLGHKKASVRAQARRKLEGFGEAAKPVLEKAKDSKDLETRMAVRELLKAIGKDDDMPPGVILHIVGPGEDLYTIAMTYGIRVSVLRNLNGLPEHAAVGPGDKIKIPVGRN